MSVFKEHRSETKNNIKNNRRRRLISHATHTHKHKTHADTHRLQHIKTNTSDEPRWLYSYFSVAFTRAWSIQYCCLTIDDGLQSFFFSSSQNISWISFRRGSQRIISYKFITLFTQRQRVISVCFMTSTHTHTHTA